MWVSIGDIWTGNVIFRYNFVYLNLLMPHNLYDSNILLQNKLSLNFVLCCQKGDHRKWNIEILAIYFGESCHTKILSPDEQLPCSLFIYSASYLLDETTWPYFPCPTDCIESTARRSQLLWSGKRMSLSTFSSLFICPFLFPFLMKWHWAIWKFGHIPIYYDVPNKYLLSRVKVQLKVLFPIKYILCKYLEIGV